jgi:hypothetical protein
MVLPHLVSVTLNVMLVGLLLCRGYIATTSLKDYIS